MRDACIKSVEAAIGRNINQAEARNIEGRIRNAMAQLARQDAAGWRAKSQPERLKEAGRFAAQELIAAANKAKQRLGLTTLATERLNNYRADQVASGADRTGLDALQRTLVAKYDLKNGDVVSAESRANAIFDNAMSQLDEVFEAVNPGLFRRILAGQWSSEPMRKAFADALHGKPSGIPAIDDAAKKYHELAEALREQFNGAGGIVGRLENWGAPHNWSSRLAIKRGQAEFVQDMMQWADPRAYVHPDGRAFSQDDMRAFFEEAWKTIASDGVTKEVEITGRPAGGSMKANRGSHHRVIHLKPEFAYDALKKYSEQNMLEAMISGVRRMARDTALVETYGPNADNSFQFQLQTALKEAADAEPGKSSQYQHKAADLQNLFDYIAGNNPPPRSRLLNDAFSIMRSIQVAAKLGGATITSMSDYAPLYQTAILNKLNPFQVALNSSLAWAPKSRRFARRMGLMIDTLVNEADRYAHDSVAAPEIGRSLASAQVKASGLGFVTNARRLGFSMTMMDAIGHLTRQKAYADVTKLQAGDRRILASKNIDQTTWDIWRAAKPDRWGANHTLLTPERIMAVDNAVVDPLVEPQRRAVRQALGQRIAQIMAMPAAILDAAGKQRAVDGANREFGAQLDRLSADNVKREAVIKLLSIVREEQDLAVITPGARERVQLTAGTQAGTPAGELVRSIALFKSFGWTVVQRHVERGLAMNHPLGRFGYLASLYVFMTFLGAASLSAAAILAGKDPPDLDVFSDDEQRRSRAVRNWLSASLKGGGLGVYGDFLFSETNPYGQSLSETILGPNVGTAAEGLGLTIGNAVQAAEGEETNFGSEAVRFARGATPFASNWYTRALTDRAIFNQLQEWTDPGAIDRMRRRQESQRGTEYWWDPGANVWEGEGPERAPELMN